MARPAPAGRLVSGGGGRRGRGLGWPAVPRPLGLTLVFVVFCGLNYLARQELWPHTPGAGPVLAAGLWLGWLILFPQLLAGGWRGLRAWQSGPGLLRWLATAGLLAGATLGFLVWLGLVLTGLGDLAGWLMGRGDG